MSHRVKPYLGCFPPLSVLRQAVAVEEKAGALWGTEQRGDIASPGALHRFLASADLREIDEDLSLHSAVHRSCVKIAIGKLQHSVFAYCQVRRPRVCSRGSQ